MTDATWQKRKYDWVESIAADATLPRLAFAVAFLLARRYLNETSHDAWVANKTLARTLNTTERSVRRAISALIEAAKLKRKLGGNGVGDTNRYELVDMEDVHVLHKEDTPDLHNHDKEDTPDRIRRTTPSKKGGRVGPPSILEDNISRGTERVRIRRDATNAHSHRRADARRLSLDPQEFLSSGRLKSNSESEADLHSHSHQEEVLPHDWDNGPRKPHTNTRGYEERPHTRKTGTRPFPTDWELTNDEIRVAHEVANWDLPKAQVEFNAFRDWALAKGATSPDWHAAWRTWCRRGDEYARRHPSPRDSEDRYLGLKAFYEMGNQEPTKH